MTYPARCSSPSPHLRRRLVSAARRQRGSMLIEAMVGVVVSASLGLGMSYAAARALAVQRNASTQNMAVLQMRGLLAAPGDLSAWCAHGGARSFDLSLNNLNAASAAATATTVTVPYTLSCSTLTPTVTGANQSATVSLTRPATLATSNAGAIASATLGGSGVLRFGQ